MNSAARRGLEAIVVGVPNMGADRLDEYSPYVDAEAGGGGKGEAYAAFLARTLKPIVDQRFRTRSARETTVVAGSSMGGLISLVTLLRHPDTFGAAGLLSPALSSPRSSGRRSDPPGSISTSVSRKAPSTWATPAGCAISS
jgi:predicted alpha/beta superfamily hydrolase